MTLAIVITVVVIARAFDYTSGFQGYVDADSKDLPDAGLAAAACFALLRPFLG